MKPIKFIGEEVEVVFDKPPALSKKPGCPDGFTWQEEEFRVAELLSEWSDFERRGRFARNMQPQNQRKAVRRGSFGVGRYYFQVRTSDGRTFELYYDRAPKNADDKLGRWSLYRELETD
ncbi:MAG TPA: hypothetical protein DEH25_02985 [Chloroflexi bacterium]|nr:hypothetical protein [Chloroflexota bacterium]HBY08209.1 hypothetical protein [Chloroflexota bacterium]